MRRKTFTLFILIVCLAGLISGCAGEKNDISFEEPQNGKSELQESSLFSAKTSVETNTNIITEIDVQTGGKGGGIITVQKYRTRFYSVPAPFVNLVGRDIYYEWMYTIDHTPNTEKMIMLQFIQHFGITREQFDKANLEFAKIIRDGLDGRPCLNPKDYSNQITDEIFNADVIFTFDDEIINEYYLSPDYPYLYASEFEEAVANGEYTSQTEEWVDIEQMEAEIIAKYGEAEQAETESITAKESIQNGISETTDPVTETTAA